MENYLMQIENLMKTYTEFRGMSELKTENELEAVAKELLKCKSIMLLTGFCIPEKAIGETDGPLGTLALAHALRLLGKEVVVMTDRFSEHLIRSGLEVLGITLDVMTLETLQDKESLETLFDKLQTDYLIAIERAGRALDGKCYSMKGVDITEFTPDADLLFKLAHLRGIKTAAIGDGGNEIGMGNVKPYITEHVAYGNVICAECKTDHLIVAGTSNWGAHALCAVLSVLSGKALTYDIFVEKQLLEILVAQGAVDGLTHEVTMAVDGIDQMAYLSIIEKMHQIVKMEAIL